jgi:hypothetical protein
VVLHVLLRLVVDFGSSYQIKGVVGEMLAVYEGIVDGELDDVVFSKFDEFIEVDI